MTRSQREELGRSAPVPAGRWFRGPPWVDAGAVVGRVWRRDQVVAISTRVFAEAPDGSGDVIPTDHVSISAAPRRASDAEIRRALVAFGMTGAEEDNHEPGIARHFWRPVDPARRVDCECKVDEVVVNVDGHPWTTPGNALTGEIDVAACRGCAFERTHGKRCPLHGRSP